MNLEQRFLESQKSRTAALHLSRENKTTLDTFWAEFHRRMAVWCAKLDSISSNSNSIEASGSANQMIQDLKEELSLLQKHCLFHHSHGSIFDGWQVPVNLPNADLRKLHQEFSLAVSLWEKRKEELCPEAKFVFKRYRRTLAQKKANGSIDTSKATPSTNFVNSAHSEAIHASQGTLSNLVECTVKVCADGSIDVEGQAKSYPALSSAVAVFRSLTDCVITIETPLQALHIESAHGCNFQLHSRVATSIHITRCVQCALHGCAQQLRIHESRELSLEISLAAGAILEGSERITFYGTDIDVADFSWLRSDSPSPNFTIENTLRTNTRHSITPSPIFEGGSERVLESAAGSSRPSDINHHVSEPNDSPIVASEEIGDDEDEL